MRRIETRVMKLDIGQKQLFEADKGLISIIEKVGIEIVRTVTPSVIFFSAVSTPKRGGRP
jgi:hypothetical protein